MSLHCSIDAGGWAGHEDAVSCLALDGNFLVSGSQDKSIRIWNLLAQVLSTAAYVLHVADRYKFLPG